MPKYTIMPCGCKWYSVELPVKELRLAFSMEAHNFSTLTPIAVRNEETKEIKIFTRELDENGNLLQIKEY